ncbi:MAG: hypothetical protein J6K24_04540 [Tidjanibacter sp.]|nr:hypothetical protein [Tidjanibacter sp.]
MKRTKTIYEAPFMEVAEVEVERGIATSPFGEAGMPGQDSGFIGGEGEDEDSIWI